MATDCGASRKSEEEQKEESLEALRLAATDKDATDKDASSSKIYEDEPGRRVLRTARSRPVE